MKTRRRSTVLHALDLFRSQSDGLTLNHLVIFLYAAENEGATLSELAAVSGQRLATASRAARALTSKAQRNSLPPHVDFLEVRINPANSNGRVVVLSQNGRRLVERLDAAIDARVRVQSAEPSYAAGTDERNVISS